MLITKTITQEVEVTYDIICNKCNNSLKSYCNYEGLIEAEITGGYGSKLGDMARYKFSLCEDCLKELFETFIHDPLVDDLFGE